MIVRIRRRRPHRDSTLLRTFQRELNASTGDLRERNCFPLRRRLAVIQEGDIDDKVNQGKEIVRR